jgi:signal transduction histidine kinase
MRAHALFGAAQGSRFRKMKAAPGHVCLMQRVLNVLTELHDPAPLVLAGLICLLATYTTLTLIIRACGSLRARYPWLIAAAVVIGCGAWATHLIALLGFHPGVAIGYHTGITILSGLIGIFGAGVGLFLARGTDRMPLGGAVIGFAISAMHYVGMAGLVIAAEWRFDPVYFSASVVVGASFGAAALTRGYLTPNLRGRIVGAFVFAAGIMGIYVVAIAGMTILPNASLAAPIDTTTPVWFAIALTTVILLIVGLGSVGALVDQHMIEADAARQVLERSQAKLRGALSAAEGASDSKSRFLATMSHELRTPLNAIIGFSDLIRNETFGPLGGDPRYKDYVNDIGHCGAHLLRLVNDILDLSKFDAGKLELREQDVNLKEVVEACLNAAEPQARKSRIHLSANIDPVLPSLRADEIRVRQVLLNLLSNALKFTREGGLVSVSAGRRKDGLALTVSDTGIGMAEHEIPKALERFGQLDSALGRKFEGSGLGLPLTKHLVELHGGTFEIVSEPGRGTMVTVIFPWSRVVAGRETLAALDDSVNFDEKRERRAS